jgi:Uma2 family endonuclease
MTLSADLIPLTKHVVLGGVTWEQYERVLERIGDRSIRVTYDDGRMEIMSPLPQHEGEAEAIGVLAREVAMEAGISIRGFGSTTYRRADRKGGLEPDKCYYLKNEPKVRGMKRFDPKVHPPPDLAIEVDVTSRSVPREPVYARLGVPEIWRSRRGHISVRILGADGAYHDAPKSAIFPFLPMAQFERFVQRMLVAEPNAIVREFRAWARGLTR